ncbi:hypothetical protein HK405_000383, partial [Cladochytrium tenue]
MPPPEPSTPLLARASGGIGRHLALHYAAHSVSTGSPRVLLLTARSTGSLEPLLAEFAARGFDPALVSAVPIALDITDPAAVLALFAGPPGPATTDTNAVAGASLTTLVANVDVVVANAGVGGHDADDPATDPHGFFECHERGIHTNL